MRVSEGFFLRQPLTGSAPFDTVAPMQILPVLEGRREALRGAWLAAALGFLAGFALISEIKVLEPLMLINFLSILEGAAAATLFAFGVAAASRRQGWFASALVAIAAAAVVCAGFVNRDFTSMALASRIYYPVPMPKSGLANQVALVITLVVGPAMFLPLGRALGRVIASAHARRTAIAASLAGQAAGIALACSFSYVGPHLLLALAMALLVIAVLRAIPAAVSVAAIVVTVGLFQTFPQRTFFNFGLSEYRYLNGGFGRDVKVDFLTFMDDYCLGTLVDNVMMMFSCRDTHWVPAETEYMYRSIIDPFDTSPTANGKPAGTQPFDADRQALDVLDVGRSVGNNGNAVDQYLGPNRNTTIEFDPMIASMLRPDHAEFLGHAFDRPDSLVLTGDYRTNLEALADEGRTFDYLFFSGIGTKTYILPRSYVFAEHFLLTKEGFQLVFDRLLKPGGVFFLDWGSSSTEEARWFVASLPPDVPRLVYWTTLSFFPLSGSPLVFVVASRDAGRLEETRRHLDRLSGFRRIVPDKEALESSKTTDDRPFLQNSMQISIGILHAVLSLLFLLLIRRFARRTRAAHGVGLKWGAVAGMAGLATGFAETIFASHNPLVLGPFGIPSWDVLQVAFLGGLAGGFLAGGRLARSRRTATLSMVLFAGGLAALFALHRSSWVFVAPMVAGAGAGMMLSIALARIPDRLQHVAMAWWLLGGAFSLLAFKPPALAAGYSGLAAITAAIAVSATVAAFVIDSGGRDA